MIGIGSFSDAMTAGLAQGRLAADGIDAVLPGAGLASLGLGVIARRG